MTMNATHQLKALGQSLWLDNISRGMLDDGILKHYIDDFCVTGLTSNPAIFQKAVRDTGSYDEAIARKTRAGSSGEALFFELAIEDLQRAADLFLPAHEASRGLDGWVSLEVSPLLASDAGATIQSAAQLHARARRPNLFIKIPGTAAGLIAIEESIFSGVPVNITLLFSREQYLQAAYAYMRAIERRIAAGLDPAVGSVASIFVSRWDVAVRDAVKPALRNRLGIAVARRAHKAYCDLLASPRWEKLAAAGAMPQRLLWASTGAKDPDAPDTLYVQALAADRTINTVPEKTLLALAAHAHIDVAMPAGAGDAEALLIEFERSGIDLQALARTLQEQGTQSFDESWSALIAGIKHKGDALEAPPARARTR